MGLEVIQKRVYDILEADSRLLSSGPALAALTDAQNNEAFPGIRRPESEDDEVREPAMGYVNLFEHPWDRKPGTHRPAIYAGVFKREPYERADLPLVINQLGIKFMTAIIPMTVVAHGKTHKEARQTRNQLKSNMLHVIADPLYHRQQGCWYEVIVAWNETESWTTVSGGNDDGIVTATVVVPILLRFNFTPGDTNDA